MSKFLSSNKRRACEICGDTKGKCRVTQDGDLHLCMNSLDEYSTPPGFRFVGTTRDGTWGQFIVDNGSTSSEDWERIKAERQRQRDERERLEQERRAAAMPAAERDTWYRKILDSLPLRYADWKDLRQRGFTDEQIERGGFKSVEKWQQLDFELPANLPGVNLNGRSLNIPRAGYLCPIKDENGLIVGMQVRTRNPEPDQPKYYWLTSNTKKRPNGPTPHLPNGELPLAIHIPAVITEAAIALVEGTGPKPRLTAERLGIVTIGAAGGQFASSPKTIERMLEALSARTGSKVIRFYPDAGSLSNKNVLGQYRRTFKLLTKLGFSIEIQWWGQETKASPDIDELEDFSQIQQITIAQFQGLVKELNIPSQEWLKQIVSKLSRKLTGLQSSAALERTLTQSAATPGITLDDAASSKILEYAEGNRLSTWQQAQEQGYKFILDQSGTGTGKSHDSGNATPALFGKGVRQVIYVSDQHRNPSTETLTDVNGWIDLEARHGGLITEETPNGGSRKKRAGKGDIPTIPGNCNRTELIGTLRGKHIQGSDTAEVICKTCPLREACIKDEGSGHGYLFQRREALSTDKLRAHPDSLTAPQEYDYSSVALIWDEPGQSITTKKDVVATLRDLEQTIGALLPYPELLGQVQCLFTALLPYLKGEEKTGKYGLSHPEVLAELQKHLPQSLDIGLLERVLRPDLSFINSTAQHGVDLGDLPANLRKNFSSKDSEMAEKADQIVIKQWLPDLLRVLQGARGVLRINGSRLIISLPDSRQQAIVKDAKAVVFLDATLSREDLALKLGCSPDEIFVCKQTVPPANNLTITQVMDLGRLGMNRGGDQKRRVEALTSHYKAEGPTTKVIDFKKFAGNGDGVWWRDSRGVNDFLEVERIVLVGTPCPNLADLQAEYAILTETYPSEDDQQFQAFVKRISRADFHQAIGRLRAHRRPEEKLEVVVLSNFDLGLPNVQQVKASEITPEAADKVDQQIQKLLKAIKQLREAGEKITQTAIAKLVGCTQARISQLLKLINFAIDGFNSKIYNSGPSPDSSVAEITEAAIEACETIEQVQESVSEIFFDWLKPHQWGYLWKQLSSKTQDRILEAVFLALPLEVLEAAT